MKRILGLDLGTNSIGWALLDSENNQIVNYGAKIYYPNESALFTKQKIYFPFKSRLLNQKDSRLKYLSISQRENRRLNYLASQFDVFCNWIVFNLDSYKRKITLGLTILMFVLGFLFSKQWQFWINIGFGGLFIVLNMDKSKKDKK